MAGAADYAYLYRTNRWKKISERQRAKNPLCEYCRQRGRAVKAVVADHVKQHKGDPEAFYTGSLQSLCATCHSAAKQREEHGKFSFDADGNPLTGW